MPGRVQAQNGATKDLNMRFPTSCVLAVALSSFALPSYSADDAQRAFERRQAAQAQKQQREAAATAQQRKNIERNVPSAKRNGAPTNGAATSAPPIGEPIRGVRMRAPAIVLHPSARPITVPPNVVRVSAQRRLGADNAVSA